MATFAKFDCRDLPAVDRFEWWCEQADSKLLPTKVTSERTDDFRASMTQLQLGQVLVSVLELPTMQSVRTRQLIRQSDPELFVLTLVGTSSVCLDQNRSQAQIAPGELLLYDTSLPFEATVPTTDKTVHTVNLYLPRRLVPVPEPALRALLARRLLAPHGAGAVLSRYLSELSTQTPTLSGPYDDRLGTAAVELATAYLAGLADAEGLLPPTTRTGALRSQIIVFILDHLDDPALSPSTVAAAHHISLRYVHRLFEREEQGVTGYIRAQRLRRCQADLVDPLLAALGVAQIGARWGFRNPAVFNRVFRRHHGISPGEYRRRNGAATTG
jgi:AraC-like DNA-binding protein